MIELKDPTGGTPSPITYVSPRDVSMIESLDQEGFAYLVYVHGLTEPIRASSPPLQEVIREVDAAAVQRVDMPT